MEPEPNIEEQLKACARLRREEAGAPFELHPATRRLLQGEVARTYGQAAAAPSPRPRSLAALWLRLALGAGACAVLALVLIQSQPRRAPSATQLALSREAVPAAPAAAPSADAAKPAEFGAMKAPDQSGEANRLAELPKLAVAPAQTAPSTDGVERSLAEGLKKDTLRAEPLRRMELADEAARMRPAEAQPQSRAAVLAETPAPPKTMTELAPQSPRPTAAKEMSGRIASAKAAQKDLAGLARAVGRDDQATLDRRSGGSGMARGGNVELKVQSAKSELEVLQKEPAAISGKTFAFTAAGLPKAEKAKAGEALGQRFMQVDGPEKYRQNFNAPPRPDVLNSFQFQQAGQVVRIIDADGSTYAGQLQVIEAPAQAQAAGQAQVLEEREKRLQAGATRGMVREADVYQLQPGQTLFFRAVGTNRSLNQKVVVDGAFLNYQQVPVAGAREKQVAAKPASQSGPLQLDQLRIQGRAVIGGNSEIPINAVPARP